MSATPPTVTVARTDDGGYCVRVEGRATMRQSPSVHEFIRRALAAPDATVTLDLRGCDYLDSTFLGCILDLHRRFGSPKPARFQIAATPDGITRLFRPTRLDKILSFRDAPPLTTAADTHCDLDTASTDAADVTRHVMECHRRLAEVESPFQAAFAKIADQMEKEQRVEE